MTHNPDSLRALPVVAWSKEWRDAYADAWEAERGRIKFVVEYATEVLKRWKSRPWETTDNAERHMKDVLAALTGEEKP